MGWHCTRGIDRGYGRMHARGYLDGGDLVTETPIYDHLEDMHGPPFDPEPPLHEEDA